MKTNLLVFVLLIAIADFVGGYAVYRSHADASLTWFWGISVGSGIGLLCPTTPKEHK